MLQLYTLGHSNHSLDVFLNLLCSRQIDVLIDVRSQPWSSYAPHFSMRQLSHAIKQSGRTYFFLGDQLGGRPESDTYYDDRGHALYNLISTDQGFLEGLDKVLEIAKIRSTAIMCSEEDPAACHRQLLIGRVLQTMGQDILHIRKDSSVQSYAEVLEANTPEGVQLGFESIFGESNGEKEWKSVRPIR